MEKHEQEQQYETLNLKRRISSLIKSISPPPRTRTRPETQPQVSLSALEAGQASTDNHLQTISAHLRKYAPNPPHAQTPPPQHHTGSNLSTNPTPNPSPNSSLPILPLDAWSTLYTSNAHPTGNHFVIHQHDHPIAGPHYDLRLQISASSSVSWAIMYGLPGDPNSKRANRNATETRVHCLWNHLIETASAKTGSMIIWDTGVYEVLPRRASKREPETETEIDSASDTRSTHQSTPANASSPGSSGIRGPHKPTESEKLRKAFQNHKINLRLHGTRLPKNYTVFLRRDKTDFRGPATPASISATPKKRRRQKNAMEKKKRTEPTTSDSDLDANHDTGSGITGSDGVSSSGKRKRGQGHDDEEVDDHEHEHAEHSDADDNRSNPDSDYLIRLHNAYPGAVNDIGSVHQRRWFIGLDRVGCGFVREARKDESGVVRRRWVRGVDKRSGQLTGFDPFYVRGPEVERSVVTGRVGGDVLRDEGVQGFVPRRGWRAVTY
ncbi:DNA polymerase ligase-domain-containing protein [Aspergillus pseudodeflectus]|uniref:DNA polymerase ligase-domain-containing protein n=1 Tax=Aspergillus pseudodeflectus TaxID=176178 RepID=A0ABR4L619_9EURO